MVFLAFAVVNIIIGGLWLIKGEINVTQRRKVGKTPARVLGGILALGGGVVPILAQTIYHAGIEVMTIGALIIVFMIAFASARRIEPLSSSSGAAQDVKTKNL